MKKLLPKALMMVAERRNKLITSILILLIVNVAFLLYIMIGTESVTLSSSALFPSAKVFAFEDFEDDREESQAHQPDDSAIPEPSTVINYFMAVIIIVASLIVFFLLYMLHFYLGTAALIGSAVWLVMGIVEQEPSLLGVHLRIIPVLIGGIFCWIKSRSITDKKKNDIGDEFGF